MGSNKSYFWMFKGGRHCAKCIIILFYPQNKSMWQVQLFTFFIESLKTRNIKITVNHVLYLLKYTI